MDNELDKIYDKVAEFSEIFKEIIQNKACMDTNPFIDNVSKYIGNYIPAFEFVFKYHLLFETILSILSSTGSPKQSFIEQFNAIYTARAAKPPPIKSMEEIRKIRPDLVVEILNTIVNSPESMDMTMFNKSSPDSPNSVSPETQTAMLSYIVNILESINRRTTETDLTDIYEACFPKQPSGGDNTNILGKLNPLGNSTIPKPSMDTLVNTLTANPITTITDAAEGTLANIQELRDPSSSGTDTPETPEDAKNPEDAKKPEDADKTCFINTKRDNKLKKTLQKNNVTKMMIKREVGHVITDEIDKLSKLVLSEKSFNRVLLKSKNPEDKSKIKMIKTVQDKVLHNYVFMIKQNDPKYGDIYAKSFTIQILQNIKLYLINIAKSIVVKAKEHSIYGLNALLLTLLQDNGIKGFILTIGRTEQYHIYTKELKHYKRIQNVQKVELNAIACLTYIYHNIATNPKIESVNGIDLKRTHNYMKQLNSGLMQKYFKGGLNPMTDMTSAMSGATNMVVPDILSQTVKQPVSSYLDPQNRYVETVIKDYVGSVISSVKKKVYTYDVYQYVKGRLSVDADDLRTTILVCVFEMFNRKSFRMFLNKLLQDNDILKQPKDTSTTQETSETDNDLVANDVILKLFLHKLTDDLNKPANKFSAEVIGKYTNLISGISTPKDTEDEVAKALQANVRKTGGGHNVTHKVWNRKTHIQYKSTPTTRKKLRVHKNKYSSTKRINLPR